MPIYQKYLTIINIRIPNNKPQKKWGKPARTEIIDDLVIVGVSILTFQNWKNNSTIDHQTRKICAIHSTNSTFDLRALHLEYFPLCFAKYTSFQEVNMIWM